MGKDKIKIGVIGTGHLGKFHTKLLKEIDNCEFSGIYDLDTKRAFHIGNEFSVNVFSTLEAMFDEVNAVSVVTTTSAHYEIVKKCFAANKHVIVEKPITATIAEAEELVRIAKEKQLIFQVGHIERFNPALLAIEKYNLQPMFVQTDRLAQFNPRGTDVAVVLDLMIHDIDIILSLIKSKVKEVHASGVAVASDKLDIANARIQFENGAVANVTASRISQKKMRKMRIFQKDGYFSMDFDSGVSEVFRLVPPQEITGTDFISFGELGVGEQKKVVLYQQPEHAPINALKHELQLFVNCVIEHKQPVVSGEDGLRALKIAEMIIEKIEQSKMELK